MFLNSDQTVQQDLGMFRPGKTDWSFRWANDGALTKFGARMRGFEFKIVGAGKCKLPDITARSNGLNKSNCFLDKTCRVSVEHVVQTYMLVSWIRENLNHRNPEWEKTQFGQWMFHLTDCTHFDILEINCLIFNQYTVTANNTRGPGRHQKQGEPKGKMGDQVGQYRLSCSPWHGVTPTFFGYQSSRAPELSLQRL